MKNKLLFLLLIGVSFFSNAQTKSSGTVALSSVSGASLSVKIDLDQTNSLATITLVGPSNKWFSIGFNVTAMDRNTDCITYGASLLDQYLPGGHNQPITDTTNSNLKIESNSVVGAIRTLVVSRPLSTGDAKDYTFIYNTISNLNIIWAIGPDTNVANEHSYFNTQNLTFSVLGNESFPTLENLTISPNPSNGIFNISNTNLIQLSKIKIFDTNAKLIKELAILENQTNIALDLTNLSKGLYFVELSNDNDKTVKKIEIN